MNFEFSEESVMLREEARNFLADHCGSAVVRDVLEGRERYAARLWTEMAAMGWHGAAIPEAYGGIGFGYEMLCILAEELGRSLAPVPFSSSIFLAAEAVLAAGDEEQKARILPTLASGESIGAFALAEGLGAPSREGVGLVAENGSLSGTKWPVPDGEIADLCIVAARDAGGIGLYAVRLGQEAVQRRAVEVIDPTRGQAILQFEKAEAERLALAGDHWPVIEKVLERAAVLTAFEQVGGAEACLYAARDYAMDRTIFGRPLASFQAIKHRLADIFVDIEIARSNAYFGVWALATGAAALPRAAAAARVAAIEAYRVAAKENIQIHGGAGFTWEFDCHLYYRRAKHLALGLGAAHYWADRLIAHVTEGERPDGL
jgi:acyl-CoA dehydrogenase